MGHDTAYGSSGNLLWLVERKIETDTPIFDRSSQINAAFTRNDFAYDRNADACICPGSKPLRCAGALLTPDHRAAM